MIWFWSDNTLTSAHSLFQIGKRPPHYQIILKRKKYWTPKNFQSDYPENMCVKLNTGSTPSQAAKPYQREFDQAFQHYKKEDDGEGHLELEGTNRMNRLTFITIRLRIPLMIATRTKGVCSRTQNIRIKSHTSLAATQNITLWEKGITKRLCYCQVLINRKGGLSKTLGPHSFSGTGWSSLRMRTILSCRSRMYWSRIKL